MHSGIDTLRQATLLLAIVICLGIGSAIISWANETEYRPLKADISLSEAIKATHILDLYNIPYRLDLPFHTIYVEASDYPRAVTAVKSAGIAMPPLPKYSQALVKAMDSAQVELDYKPVYEQAWFMKLARLSMAALVMCVLIIVVMRPMVRDFLSTQKELAEPQQGDRVAIANSPQPLTTLASIKTQAQSLLTIDVLRQAILVLALVFCVGIAVSIILWAKTPTMRPLINDLRTVDAVKVSDMLEQHGIYRKTDPDSHMLYVADQHATKARLLLATIGITIEYPKYSKLDKQTLELLQLEKAENEQNILTSPQVLKMFRLLIAAFIIIVFIIVIMRPILRVLIYPESLEPSEENRIK